MNAGARIDYGSLDFACENGFIQVIKELLSVKPDVINVEDVCEIC